MASKKSKQINLTTLLIRYGKHTPDITDTDNEFYKAPQKGKFTVNRADGKVYIGVVSNGKAEWKCYTPKSQKLIVTTTPRQSSTTLAV